MNQILDTKRTLFPNGLKVLTHRLPDARAAALHFCVQAGYFLESDSEIGLAHLLEHMYFKGSARFPVPGTIGTRMKSLGGIINASTSYDQTNYYCAVPAENLLAAFEIMADAFLDPLFPKDELRRECEVVIEEFNRKLDSPSAYSLEKLIQLAYTNHRMKRWRIGTPEQLRTYTRDHLFEYFHRYYVPSNVTVTITGEFNETEIFDRITGSLAGWKDSIVQKDFGPKEPVQNSPRYASCKGEATQSYLHLGFHAPGVLSEEGPSLEFLTFLLSGGRSSRLHRSLVEQKRSASSISCGYSAYEDVGLVIISAVTEAPNIRQAGNDIWTSLLDVCEKGIAPEEIGKVKNKLRLYRATQTEEALGLAQILGYYEAYGGFERIEQHQQAMETLTEEQIVTVARKYLRSDNLSVLEFVNEKLPPITSDQYFHNQMSLPPAAEVALPAPIQMEMKTTAASIRTEKPIIHKGKITYILQSDSRYSHIAAGLYFLGGRNQETDSNAGITHLLLRTLLKGTRRWSAEQIAFEFDSRGNPPRMNSARDYAGYNFETLPEYFLSAWNLLLHCLCEAEFPKVEIETEKRKILATIQRNLDDNLQRPMQLFQRAFYGKHPYGLPETGFEESISSLNQNDLRTWSERLMAADRAVAVIVGNFDSSNLIPSLEMSLEGLPASRGEWFAPSTVLAPMQNEMAEMRPKKQTAFFLGFPAATAADPEIHKYSVLQQVLSGMGGRLFQNLRSRKSLAYSVYAGISSNLYSGTFATYIAGNASKEKEAMEGMWEELSNLTNDGISSDELQNAVHALLGSYILGTQTASSLVQDHFNSYILGRPIPFFSAYREILQTIRTEEVQEIARKTFVRDNSAIGIVRGTTQLTEAEKLVLA